MTKIKIEVIEDDYKKIESFQWNTVEWDRLEKTWSYLRKKYGSFFKKFIRQEPKPEEDSWVNG